MHPPSGWYTDPYDARLERYWNGLHWAPETRPAVLAPPPPGEDGDPTQAIERIRALTTQGTGTCTPRPRRTKRRLVLGVVVLAVAALVSGLAAFPAFHAASIDTLLERIEASESAMQAHNASLERIVATCVSVIACTESVTRLASTAVVELETHIVALNAVRIVLGDDSVVAVRDRYIDHVLAWIEHWRVLEHDPGAINGAETYAAINTTFAAACAAMTAHVATDDGPVRVAALCRSINGS